MCFSRTLLALMLCGREGIHFPVIRIQLLHRGYFTPPLSYFKPLSTVPCQSRSASSFDILLSVRSPQCILDSQTFDDCSSLRMTTELLNLTRRSLPTSAPHLSLFSFISLRKKRAFPHLAFHLAFHPALHPSLALNLDNRDTFWRKPQGAGGLTWPSEALQCVCSFT